MIHAHSTNKVNPLKARNVGLFSNLWHKYLYYLILFSVSEVNGLKHFCNIQPHQQHKKALSTDSINFSWPRCSLFVTAQFTLLFPSRQDQRNSYFKGDCGKYCLFSKNWICRYTYQQLPWAISSWTINFSNYFAILQLAIPQVSNWHAPHRSCLFQLGTETVEKLQCMAFPLYHQLYLQAEEKVQTEYH